MKERDQSIDLVKIIAMMMVLLLHTGVVRGWSGGYGPVPEVYQIAGIAMPLFLLASGYLLAGKTATLKYCARKIWGILRFTFIICAAWNLILFLFGKVDFREAVVAFIRDFPGCLLQYGYFFHFWYFGAMIIIYALLPVLHSLIHSKYLKYAIAATFILSTAACVADVYCFFEKEHVRQTLRLWYWLFYFLSGAFLNLHKDKIPSFNWLHAFIAMCVFVIFAHFVDAGGNEYLFGSVPCMAYAIITFIACLNTRIRDNAIIANLSKCFLPVYAIHIILLLFMFNHQPMIGIERLFIPQIAIAVEYLTASSVIILVSLAITRIPYMDRIFRI